MHKSLIFVTVLIAVFVFVQLSLAQAVPREVSTEDQDKIITPARVQPKPIDPNAWQRSLDLPNRTWYNPNLAQLRFGALPTDTKLSFGPIRLVSRLVGRVPGQDVYYQTWERPQITLWGISPTFSLRRDRYTKEYSFRAGIRIRF